MCKTDTTTWGNYYEKWVDDQYLLNKKLAFQSFLETTSSTPSIALDLGANDGMFSFLASKYYSQILSFDIDPVCVEQNYLTIKKESIANVLPLIIDFTNPVPAIGWNNEERDSIVSSIGKIDTIIALAVIHHLCIGKNIPMLYLAEFMKNHCKNLIIEFVPKSDEKVKILLKDREDIFENYTIENFKEVFSVFYIIQEQILLSPTERILFLMKLRN